MVGRNDEFAELKAALTEIYAGRGQIVSVIGEAGIGKSRLVTEFKRIALASADLQSEVQSCPPLWLEGRCIELGMTVNYWSFIDAFREYFNWGSEDDDCTRGKRIVSVTQDMVKQEWLSEEQLRKISSRPDLGTNGTANLPMRTQTRSKRRRSQRLEIFSGAL